jgi:hypothetical protein
MLLKLPQEQKPPESEILPPVVPSAIAAQESRPQA